MSFEACGGRHRSPGRHPRPASLRRNATHDPKQPAIISGGNRTHRLRRVHVSFHHHPANWRRATGTMLTRRQRDQGDVKFLVTSTSFVHHPITDHVTPDFLNLVMRTVLTTNGCTRGMPKESLGHACGARPSPNRLDRMITREISEQLREQPLRDHDDRPPRCGTRGLRQNFRALAVEISLICLKGLSRHPTNDLRSTYGFESRKR